jgi:hypothetical protein
MERQERLKKGAVTSCFQVIRCISDLDRPDENGDDRDHHQQLDQRERTATGDRTMLTPDSSWGETKIALGAATRIRGDSNIANSFETLWQP